MPEYDVIIAGLGAMGSAAAYHLARRSLRVAGCDRFRPPHRWGSSHGQTRIIREAYYEHPLYVPLVQRARALWEELETESRQELLLQTGGLMIGAAESELLAGAKRSADLHHLPYELLSAAAIRQRFPQFQLADDIIGLWEPRTGMLFPEKCIATHLVLAQQHGAALRFDETITGYRCNGGEVIVTTTRGRYRAGKLLISAGGWVTQLVPALAAAIRCERQVIGWFVPDHPAPFTADHFPIFMWETNSGSMYYGFPDLGSGLKVARHHDGELTSPDTIRREVDAEEVDRLRRFLQQHLPNANGALAAAEVCLYTNTPDHHFLLDFHPESDNVLIASPCSGHGFKFSSVIGEMVADLLMTGNAAFDLRPFSLTRLLG